jgi:ribosome hibernation promoting factor
MEEAMDLQIRGNDVDVTNEVQSTARRHASRLDRLVDRVVDAKLELRKQSQRTGGEVTIAQVTLQTGKSTLRAEERDHDPIRAVDAVMEKLERQVRRHHERKTDRHGRRLAPYVDEAATEELDEDVKIVRTKRFPVKPMDAEEAIDQMELLGHDFFLFENTDVKTVTLVYRRRDGTYGLLIPERM